MTRTNAAQRWPAEGAGTYPRPQLVRPEWCELSGTWDFGYDDDDVGVAQRWWEADLPFDRRIVVPFPPESLASGIADPGFHPVVWYRRTLTRDDLLGAGLGRQGDRIILHFGAVDYQADVWLAGSYLGRHEGGHTPFMFDISPVLAGSGDAWPLVVRAADDPRDVAQPRGKQDWQEEPHGIWYHRTTGIWQPVWLEAVPDAYVSHLAWSSDLRSATVELSLELSSRPAEPAVVSVQLTSSGEPLADVEFKTTERRARTVIHLPRQENRLASEALLWTPENPHLVDASIRVSLPDGRTDHIQSYLGLRSVGWSAGHFMLNDRPYYLRAVLSQGYWPDTHLAAANAEALRAEAQLVKDLGFNTVRIHEKVEDPRFLYWTDRLGLLVWGESPSTYEFSSTSVVRVAGEWIDIIRRDFSHPSIMAWVPFNESWGVQNLAHDPRQLDFIRALYHLTKSLDPGRPVISNDGWEHADSDLWTIHDYGLTGADLQANYVDADAVRHLMSGLGPLGRRMKLLDVPDRGQPIIVSEFGGISYAPADPDRSWGYVTVSSEADFEARLREMFTALQSSPILAGFCYTQLTDTLQEANGIADPWRRPKLPVSTIRSIVFGEDLDTSAHRRPKQPVERPSVASEAAALLRAQADPGG
jgi:beta-galactosidase/beta-glucuronidase